MKIYFDLDGVIRNLKVNGEPSDDWFCRDLNGKTFNELVDDNLDLLVKSEPTAYYPVIREFSPITIMTCQPKNWRPYTEKWISNHFDEYSLIYVEKIEDKEMYLNDSLIVEDYPFYSSRVWDKLIMVDYPYNRKSKCLTRVNRPRQLRDILKRFYIENRV